VTKEEWEEFHIYFPIYDNVLLTPNKETVVSKVEKLIQVLSDAANAVTPSNGGQDGTESFDPHAALVEVSYRVGRALTLARDIARNAD